MAEYKPTSSEESSQEENIESNKVEKNLKKEANRRGVDPSRLIFAQKVRIDEHLKRHELADLFLDTFD